MATGCILRLTDEAAGKCCCGRCCKETVREVCHRWVVYSLRMRTPIKHPADPMYAEFEVHRTMIRDRVRTEAFRRAIDAVVRPCDVVLDVGP